MVWRQEPLTKLDNNGIKGNMFNCIHNFIHNPSIAVRINGQFSDKTNIINGIPVYLYIMHVPFVGLYTPGWPARPQHCQQIYTNKPQTTQIYVIKSKYQLKRTEDHPTGDEI